MQGATLVRGTASDTQDRASVLVYPLFVVPLAPQCEHTQVLSLWLSSELEEKPCRFEGCVCACAHVCVEKAHSRPGTPL